MPRRKTPQPPQSELADAVQMLTEELKVLRMVVDELREEVQWANQNHHDESPILAGRRIRSCSLDPCSTDFAVNTVDEATVEQLRSELSPLQTVSGKQGELFD